MKFKHKICYSKGLSLILQVKFAERAKRELLCFPIIILK